ncbi:hypothetical protein NA57DRAFT_40700, partial [Rhizodiscina lignyota]
MSTHAQDLLPSEWKSILRPIRDGLRDRFPSKPQSPPDLENRRKRRELDALKGFAYFEDFDEVDDWAPEDVDPLQRSSIPLLKRPELDDASQQKARVLLCHDFAGNYHDYESSAEHILGAESYSCEYLQFVEAFVYFSHKLVCIPPPMWTNTLHRNGVKSLGTLLIEPGNIEIERLLVRQEASNSQSPHFVVARQLANMAHIYEFDGWLLNLEKPFPSNKWDPFLLIEFIKQLRVDLGPAKQVVWYDALTIDNTVAYQNALTKKNLSFTQAAGSMLTNYAWSNRSLSPSKNLALKNQIPPQNIYFGIDVWAQNKQSGPHKRITFPGKGGGGTNTGTAVGTLALEGFSAGIFAPAWSFEHFPGYERRIERTMWEGLELPAPLKCDCGESELHKQVYPQHPIVRWASEFPAGSETFLFTKFKRAFQR